MNTFKKIFNSNLVIILILAIFTICLSSCENNDYDNGYESAWSGYKSTSIFSSKETCMGYQQGLEDAATYDDGYYDGYNNKRPQHTNDYDYMDGYNDGKSKR